MSETLRDQLARGADEVERPVLDVADLVAQAERRLVRRRLAAVAAGAAAVAVVVTGGFALRSDDSTPSPAPPPPPATTSGTPEPEADTGPAIYFDALAVAGDDLTDPILSINGQKDIYLARQGEAPRQLIATGANEHCPRVSPDGSMLAYLEGPRTVVVRRLDPNGDPKATATRARFDGEQVTCPQWSPDGGEMAVAVAGYEAPDQFLEVRVIEPDGSSRVVATRRDQYMPPPDIAWSPTGDAIAFTTPDSVWVAPLDGGEPTMVWQGRPPEDPTSPLQPGTPQRLAWLSTGELAVGALVQYTDVGQDETIHLIDPGSGQDRVLRSLSIDSTSTWSWSPDGSRFLFAVSDGGIHMFDRATGDTVALQPRLDGRPIPLWQPVWSTDGRLLVATAADADPSTTVFALVTMRPDRAAVQVLTPWGMALYSTADASWGSG